MPKPLLWLIAGVIALDFAVQAVHVSSQSLIIAAGPAAASRTVGAYMCFIRWAARRGYRCHTALFPLGMAGGLPCGRRGQRVCISDLVRIASIMIFVLRFKGASQKTVMLT